MPAGDDRGQPRWTILTSHFGWQPGDFVGGSRVVSSRRIFTCTSFLRENERDVSLLLGHLLLDANIFPHRGTGSGCHGGSSVAFRVQGELRLNCQIHARLQSGSADSDHGEMSVVQRSNKGWVKGYTREGPNKGPVNKTAVMDRPERDRTKYS